MNFEKLKKEIKYLSFSRKLILTGSILGLLFLFFPWGQKLSKNSETGELIFDENTLTFAKENFHAFGLFSVFGWTLTFFYFFTLLLLVREVFKKRQHYQGISHSYLWLFLGGLSTYTVLIALFVLNSFAMKNIDSESDIQIGVFLSLFAGSILFSGGWIAKKDEEKAYIKDSLTRSQPVDPSSVHLEAEPPLENQMSLGDYD